MIIIYFALFLTIVFAKTQEQYIDFLPNEEKQQFLDNVARRIMESVESYGINKGSRELTDDQLKKHNSYIQSVMEQETAAFKARRDKRENKSSEEDNKTKENDEPEEDLEVKSSQFRDNDEMDSAEAGMNRRSNDKILQENETDVPKIGSVTEDALYLQTRSITSDVNSEETTVASTMKNSYENVKYQLAYTINPEMQFHDSTLVESTTKAKDLTIKTTNATAIKRETSSFTSTLQELDVSTETTTGSKVKIFEYDSATKGNDDLVNKFVQNSNATESYTQYGSHGTLTSFLIYESTTDLLKDTTNESSDLVSTIVNSQVLATITQNVTQVNTATTENYSAVSEDGHLQTITETTTITPILTTSNIEEEGSTKKPNEIKLSKTVKQSEKDSLVSYVASKALSKIKLELELKKKFDSEVKTINKGNTHLNHYQIYEIPWPIKRDNQPFIRSQEPIKNQPYYVPVYKYSPKFAYYNPKNRLGPNEVEENSIELDTRHLREGNNNAHDKAESSEFILQLNNEMRKFIHLFHWNKTFSTTTTTTVEPEEPWDFFLNPFANRPRRSTTRAPRTPLKNRRTRRTTTRAPRDHSESKEQETTKSPPKKGWYENGLFGFQKEKDMFINLAKLHTLKLPLMRSKAESKVNIYINVLKDLILEDSKSLKQYDWLTTTVQIQSALTKTLKLIKRIRQSEQLYPADLQILRYMVFLHNFSLELKKENNKMGNKLRETVKSSKNTMFKEKHLISRDWVYLRKPQTDQAEDDELSHLYKFMIDVQDGLFDLHEAIGQIADVTKFDRQNWYSNLKHLYLSADEKHLRELLLHISMSRLVDLVEHSCKQGLDRDFIQFLKTNKKVAKRIVDEMLFINDIVHEIAINK